MMTWSVFAQLPADFSNLDVNSLSKAQLVRIQEDIDSKGLSLDDALNFAKARGAREDQVMALRARLLSLSEAGDRRVVGRDEGSSEKRTLSVVKKPVEEPEIPLFGFNLFNREGLTFSPSTGGAVSDSYILGVGDELMVDIWGVSEQQYTLSVGRDGKVSIPQAGQLMLKGVRLGEAKAKIEKRLARIYSDLESEKPVTFVNVSVSSMRTISVNVVGEVFLPGTYTLEGNATLFNALYYAGGPNEKGSFRHINLMRGGKKVATLDVYDFLIKGKTDVNKQLEDGDLIFIPPFVNRIVVEGAVKRSGSFETKDGETLSDLIKYAGGFTSQAYERNMNLTRKSQVGQVMKTVEEEFYDSFILKNGDHVFVGSVTEHFENRVRIGGAVFRSGEFELTEGLTVKKLIDQAEGLKEDAFLGRGLIFRLKDGYIHESVSFKVRDVLEGRQEILLQREDSVHISSVFDLKDPHEVRVDGEVRQGGVFRFSEGMTLQDLILLAGGLKESAAESYVEVSRRLSYVEASRFSDTLLHVYQFDIARDLSLSENGNEFALQQGDYVYVKRLPSFSKRKTIFIEGEVKYPGSYALELKEDRLSDVVERAGGVSPYAFVQGATLLRKEVTSVAQEHLQERLDSTDQTFIVEEIQEATVAINLERALKEGGRHDIILEDGDRLVVPQVQTTVSIHGEVLNPHIAPFEKRGNARVYINQSGGFTSDAVRRKTYVIHPNGMSSKTNNYILFKDYPRVSPGAKVYVPKKNRENRERLSMREWVGISTAVTSIAVSIVSMMAILKD